MPTAAAIANAVGVRIKSLPITAEKVFAALNSRKASRFPIISWSKFDEDIFRLVARELFDRGDPVAEFF